MILVLTRCLLPMIRRRSWRVVDDPLAFEVSELGQISISRNLADRLKVIGPQRPSNIVCPVMSIISPLVQYIIFS